MSRIDSSLDFAAKPSSLNSHWYTKHSSRRCRFRIWYGQIRPIVGNLACGMNVGIWIFVGTGQISSTSDVIYQSH